MPELPASGEEAVIRVATAEDLPFMGRMLAFAAHWRSPEPPPVSEVLLDPHNAVYLRDWGRPSDVGFVAERGGTPSGAAWFRLFAPGDAGYGFIDEFTPEVTIAVEPRFRGQGLATALLGALAEAATRAGCPALSLSVERENHAARIYRRAGYETVGALGGSWTMRKPLPPGAGAAPGGV